MFQIVLSRFKQKIYLIIVKIFTDDIIQVWRNSDVLNNIRQFRNTPITCRSCEDVDTCHGGCRASAQTYSGDTLGYDPMMPERRK